MTEEPKVTLSASVPPSLKKRFQQIATAKRWSLSQTVIVFIEEYLDQWEKDLGLDQTVKGEGESKKKTRRPTAR
jgi:hypothetical protein